MGRCNEPGAHERRNDELKEYFTDTEPLRRKLEGTALRSKFGKKHIFSIKGTGQVGKSSLLRMFRIFCKEKKIPVALVSAKEVKTQVELLQALKQELAQDEIHLKSFDKRLEQYGKIKNKMELAAAKERREKILEAGRKIAGGGVGAAGKFVPVLEPFKDLASGVMDLLAAVLRKPEDIDLYRNATKRLTDDFIKDLGKKARDRFRIVLMIDAYEQLGGEEVDRWFCDWLRQSPSNALVVVAGREGLGRPEWETWWPGWAVRVWFEELPKMNEQDVLMLVGRYYRVVSDGQEPDSVQVEKIVRWARGNLLAVTTAVRSLVEHSYTDFDDTKPKVLDEVVRFLLEGTPKALQHVLEAAATVRWFNKEVLRALAEPKDVGEAFEELTRWTFVCSAKRGWAIDDSIRGMMNERLRFNDPTHHRDLHERASNFYYRKLLEKTDEHDYASLEDRQKWELERLFHEFQLAEARGLAFFRKAFEEAFFDKRQFDFCRALVNELDGYKLEESSKRWAQYYEGLMAVYLGNDPDRPRRILEELLDKPNLDKELKVSALEYLAAILWFYFLREEGATKQAEQLYKQALALRRSDPNDIAGQARVLIWLGVLHQRTEGTGEGYFKQAQGLCKDLGDECERIQAWAEQEFSISYRMRGRFSESETLIKKSIERFEKLGLKFDKAGSLFNYAMLLIYQGRLIEAEQQLRQRILLYERCPQSRILERAWPLVGEGDIALRRGQYSESVRRFTRVLDMGQKVDDNFVKSLGLGGLAAAHVGEGRWAQAIDEADECLELQRKNKDKFGLGWTLNTKGNALLHENRFQDALECFRKGLQHMREYGSYWGQSKLMLGACQVYFQEGKGDQFNHAAESIRSWADKYGYSDDLARLCFLTGDRIIMRDAKLSGGATNKEALHEAAACFLDAMGQALKHNIYLLDDIKRDIVGSLQSFGASGENEGRSICSAVVSCLIEGWETETRQGKGLVTWERERRAHEDDENTHQETVLEALTGIGPQ